MRRRRESGSLPVNPVFLQGTLDFSIIRRLVDPNSLLLKITESLNTYFFQHPEVTKQGKGV